MKIPVTLPALGGAIESATISDTEKGLFVPGAAAARYLSAVKAQLQHGTFALP